MKSAYIVIVSLLLSSCIPVKVAPRFKNQDYRIIQAKKFKRKLPRETSFIFKDPKADGEFYDYINTKYELNNNNVGLNTPILIDGETVYLSYSETDKEDATLNLPLVIIDKKLEQEGYSTVFDGNYSNRKGHWYILITVFDTHLENCLLDKHPLKPKVVEYLKVLKEEYITTHNYQEVLFKKKP